MYMYFEHHIGLKALRTMCIAGIFFGEPAEHATDH